MRRKSYNFVTQNYRRRWNGKMQSSESVELPSCKFRANQVDHAPFFTVNSTAIIKLNCVSQLCVHESEIDLLRNVKFLRCDWFIANLNFSAHHETNDGQLALHAVLRRLANFTEILETCHAIDRVVHGSYNYYIKFLNVYRHPLEGFRMN